MFVSLGIKNLFSFYEKEIFSLEATRIKEYEDTNCIFHKKKKFFKVISIHGLNGAGKSNLFLTLFELKKLVLESLTMGSSILRKFENFKFIENSENEISEIDFTFALAGVDYCLTIHLKNENIIYEKLTRTLSKETIIYERIGSNWDEIIISKKYILEQKIEMLPEEYKTGKILLLSLLIHMDLKADDLFNSIGEFFAERLIILNGANENHGCSITHEFLDKNPDNKDRLLKLMKKYCLGMSGFIYQSKEEEIPFEELKNNKKIPEELLKRIEAELKENSNNMKISKKDVKISNVYDVYNSNFEKVDEKILNFEKYTSKGTKALYNIIGAIYDTLDNGGVLMIDEALGLLHPIIIEDIIELFNDKNKNDKNAQIIMTGQNPNIMDTAKLRRDQIYIFTKNLYGATKIQRLSDYKNIKSSSSFSRNYLMLLREQIKH
ncbi:AAA family ATPase [Cetobacterium ceti]